MIKILFSGVFYNWKTQKDVFIEDVEIMSLAIPNVGDLVSFPETQGRLAKVANIRHMFNPLAPEGERHIVYINLDFD